MNKYFKMFQLTGITQQMVDGQPDLEKTLKVLLSYTYNTDFYAFVIMILVC